MMFQPLSLLVSLLLITSLSLATASLEKAKMSLMADVMNSEDLEDLEAQLRQALQALVASKPLGSVAIVGGGLSGLTSSLWLLENGYEVMLIDRSNFLGGNSAKASSGINGAYTYYYS